MSPSIQRLSVSDKILYNNNLSLHNLASTAFVCILVAVYVSCVYLFNFSRNVICPDAKLFHEYPAQFSLQDVSPYT